MSKDKREKGEETLETFALRANLIGTGVLLVTIARDISKLIVSDSCVWLDVVFGVLTMILIGVIIYVLSPSRIDAVNRNERIRVFTRKKGFETFTVVSAIIYGAENIFGKAFVESICNKKLTRRDGISILLGVAIAVVLLIYEYHEDKKIITDKTRTNTVDIEINADTDADTSIDIDINTDTDTNVEIGIKNNIDVNVDIDANTDFDISIDIDTGATTSGTT